MNQRGTSDTHAIEACGLTVDSKGYSKFSNSSIKIYVPSSNLCSGGKGVCRGFESNVRFSLVTNEPDKKSDRCGAAFFPDQPVLLVCIHQSS